MKKTQANINYAEIIRSLTPIFLASVGASIGLAALFFTTDSTQLTSAMGLAGTAIAGASGLAQPEPNSSKSKSNPSEEEDFTDRTNIHNPDIEM